MVHIWLISPASFEVLSRRLHLVQSSSIAESGQKCNKKEIDNVCLGGGGGAGIYVLSHLYCWSGCFSASQHFIWIKNYDPNAFSLQLLPLPRKAFGSCPSAQPATQDILSFPLWLIPLSALWPFGMHAVQDLGRASKAWWEPIPGSDMTSFVTLLSIIPAFFCVFVRGELTFIAWRRPPDSMGSSLQQVPFWDQDINTAYINPKHSQLASCIHLAFIVSYY